ncbi:SCO family protein [Pseudoalteromonas sp. A25]|uniref:SCO family protein n=1 Tax=Pseudoalteromonas sp. A25 TaxID=116092 RepID=UPI00156248A1|nr:SCO family protein [Pseudoalteromonas sp. A25]
MSCIVPYPATQAKPIEWLRMSKELANFNLTTVDGLFNNQSVQGGWTFILFGYIECPDICPLGLTLLSEVETQLSDTAFGNNVQFVFVAVDLNEQQATEVDKFTQYFSSSLIGVVGKQSQLNTLAKSLGSRYKIVSDGTRYSVSHTPFISIVDPKGQLIGRFKHPQDAPSLVQHFLSYVSVYDKD